MINWAAFDLNLLRVLDAMFRERNTTRVGETIGLSQPAVSSALNRLRHALGDPLFVREHNTMVPTPFAAALEEPLLAALERIQRTLSGGAGFDPAHSTLRFRLLGDDFLAELLMPGLIATLLDRAPGIRVQLIPTNPRPLSQQLAERTIDMAFWIPEETPEWVHRASALRASVVAVASKRNRAIADSGVKPGEPLPLDLFCALPQVMFAPGGNLASREDEGLAAIGRRRHVMVTVPDFFGVARVAAQSQLIGDVPTRFAPAIARRLGLHV